MSNRKFSIDEEAGVIHYVTDEDTGQVEHIPISDILEFFVWFKRREGVLRKMVSNVDPIPVFKPMMRMGDFYIGVCGEGPFHRARVKVKGSRWAEIMEQTAKVVRANWLYDLRQADLPIAELEYFDTSGNPLPGPQDSKGNVLLNLHSDRAKLTESDCPDYLVQAEIQKRMNPEWWVLRDDNLSRGEYVKLP